MANGLQTVIIVADLQQTNRMDEELAYLFSCSDMQNFKEVPLSFTGVSPTSQCDEFTVSIGVGLVACPLQMQERTAELQLSPH